MTDTVVAALIGACATIVAALVGVWIGRRTDTNARHSPLEKEERALGLRITEPREGVVLPRGSVEIAGTFSTQPQHGSMFLLTSGPTGRLYWPQVGQPIEFSESRKTWRGSAWIEGDGLVLVVTVGSGGRSLFAYFQKVGQQRQEYLPIEQLPSDVREHDRMFIRVSP
jgi:hypothetical protein